MGLLGGLLLFGGLGTMILVIVGVMLIRLTPTGGK